MNTDFTGQSFSDITLRDFYYVLFRHKKKMVIFFLMVVIAFSLQVYYSPDLYVSEASLLVTAGRENVEMIPTTGDAVSVSRSSNINTEIEILKTREIIEAVVDRIGIENFIIKANESNTAGEQKGVIESGSENTTSIMTSENITQAPSYSNEMMQLREDIIHSLMNTINLSVTQYTSIINISYQSRNPALAYDIVSNLIEVFREKRTAIHYSSGSFEFFNEQAAKYQDALNDIEEQIVELKNKLNIGSVEDYRSSLLGRIDARQQEIEQTDDAIAESESKIEFLRNQLKNIPLLNDTDTIIDSDDIRTELSTLRDRLRELLVRYSEENVQVKEVRRQIQETQKLILSESQITDNVYTDSQQIYQDLIAEQQNLASLQAKKDALSKRPSNFDEEISQLNEVELEIFRLERERDSLYENYTKYANNLEEARIDQIVQSQNITNIKVLQPATYPISPLEKRKFRNLALGLFIGFFSSIGLAYIYEYMDHSIKSQEDVEKWLELRSLVTIPEYSKKKSMM